VWGHAGGNRSGTSQVMWVPEKRAVLALVLNTPAALVPFSERLFDRFTRAAFAMSAPRPATPPPGLRIDNPQRFVGTYVRTGSRYEVTEDQGWLRFKATNTGFGIPGEQLGVVVDGKLTPLGPDRFVVLLPGSAQLPVAFFGNDDRGRAGTLIAPSFAAGRIE
jgi:hypothetical protein